MEPPEKRPTKDFNQAAGKITYLEFCLKQTQRPAYEQFNKTEAQKKEEFEREEKSKREERKANARNQLRPAPPGRPQSTQQRDLELDQIVNNIELKNRQQFHQQSQTRRLQFLEQLTGQQAPERGKTASSQSDRTIPLQERFVQSADRRQQAQGRRRDDRER